MTVVADAKCRLTLGRRIKPGEVFLVEGTGDELKLTRLERPAAAPAARGRGRTRNGIPLLPRTGRVVTREEVNAYLYDQDGA